MRSLPRRRKDPSFWKAINRVLVILVFVAALITLGLTFYPEISRRNEMSRHLDAEKEKLAAQELLRKQREREVYLLENDPTYVEVIARDKLDLMKPGETIYRFDSAVKSPPGAKN